MNQLKGDAINYGYGPVQYRESSFGSAPSGSSLKASAENPL